jgi:hypothetical protein
MFKLLKKGDALLFSELPLLLLLLLVIILRFPNFFEPYWYGDEAIYLTVGTALRQGALMYAEIVDHKTPLIYYFAAVPNQLAFRVLMLGWMLGTTALFYHFALRLFKRIFPAVVSSLFFVIYTSVPWYEGNIPNGELFVMGFILAGGLLLLYTQIGGILLEDKRSGWLSPPKPGESSAAKKNTFAHSIQTTVATNLTNTHDVVLYLAAGVFFGLAVLTKVPAIFDVAAFLALGWFALVNTVPIWPFSFSTLRTWFAKSFDITTDLILIILSVGLVILASILYYASKGTLSAYIDLGLLYNFKYIQAWNPGFTNAVAIFLISLPGKITVVASIILTLSFGRAFIDRRLQFLVGWFSLSMMAALLSNRPYPHYFLQILPPLCLLGGLAFLQLQFFFYKRTWQTMFTADLRPLVLTLSALVLCLWSFSWIKLQYAVVPYPTREYYVRTYKYLTGQLSREEFYQQFNWAMKDNYKAAEIITKVDEPHLFIWGNNATLYALTQRSPVGRFTVTFHITDFKAETETFEALVATRPTFAVIMKNETAPLPGLQEFLFQNYLLNADFDTFELWMKK